MNADARLRRLDARTAALFAMYAGLFAVNGWAALRGLVPLAVSFLIGLWVFNLSFTIWHECVHQTFSRSRALNAAVGRFTALLMIYPGYSALRREHLLHHRHQGDPDRDPVYPRVQCPAWLFPFHLLRMYAFNPQPPNPEARLTARERLADGAGHAVAAAAIVALAAAGQWRPFLAAWLLPRAILIPVHAYYVCFLPHTRRGLRVYEVYRVVLRNPFTRYLTLYHAYHGLHHVWPAIPWHRYQAVFRARRRELEQRGVEIIRADR